MAKVEIVRSLFQEIETRFIGKCDGHVAEVKHLSIPINAVNHYNLITAFIDKGEAHKVIDLLESLETSPHKGKFLGTIGGIVIKELKYKNFRFYFITDGFKIKCLEEEKLVGLLLRFVRMSDKNHQQETINEIRYVLRIVGAGGFK